MFEMGTITIASPRRDRLQYAIDSALYKTLSLLEINQLPFLTQSSRPPSSSAMRRLPHPGTYLMIDE